ncbi:hypothetical protein [Paenarthrobacter nicotinovorans]|uniref:hypothetical protein n=1 Tax=Paenarthrobacter nicotinovorans TaxID=29320 RepID=UPI003749FBC2
MQEVTTGNALAHFRSAASANVTAGLEVTTAARNNHSSADATAYWLWLGTPGSGPLLAGLSVMQLR